MRQQSMERTAKIRFPGGAKFSQLNTIDTGSGTTQIYQTHAGGWGFPSGNAAGERN